jgi:hypothetical protein
MHYAWISGAQHREWASLQLSYVGWGFVNSAFGCSYSRPLQDVLVQASTFGIFWGLCPSGGTMLEHVADKASLME